MSKTDLACVVFYYSLGPIVVGLWIWGAYIILS